MCSTRSNLTNSTIIDNDMLNATYVGSADLRIFEGVSGLTITRNRMANGVDYAMRISDIGTGAPDATGILFNFNSITNYGQANAVAVTVGQLFGHA